MSTDAQVITLDVGEGQIVDLGNIRIIFKAVSADTGGAFTLAEYIGGPGSGSQLHTHHNEDESFFILSGAMTFQLEDRVFEAAAGAFVLLPRGTRHAFATAGPEPVKAVMTFSPAGLEHFFVELSELTNREDEPSPEEIDALSQRYGLDFS
jgi:quercetin dioxygenase-like cupin family protein